MKNSLECRVSKLKRSIREMMNDHDMPEDPSKLIKLADSLIENVDYFKDELKRNGIGDSAKWLFYMLHKSYKDLEAEMDKHCEW